jgi:hypothetical protein
MVQERRSQIGMEGHLRREVVDCLGKVYLFVLGAGETDLDEGVPVAEMDDGGIRGEDETVAEFVAPEFELAFEEMTVGCAVDG